MTTTGRISADDGLPDDTARCPCCSGDLFGGCCGALLRRTAAAPTAERLMRSRYTAFSVGDAAYLRRTWHPSTRPASIEIEADLEWRRLAIVDRTGGGPFDQSGEVAFEAFWRQGDARGSLRERSRFVREDRRWFYVDGDVR